MSPIRSGEAEGMMAAKVTMSHTKDPFFLPMLDGGQGRKDLGFKTKVCEQLDTKI